METSSQRKYKSTILTREHTILHVYQLETKTFCRNVFGDQL